MIQLPLLFLAVLSVAMPLWGQDTLDSPVFKRFRTPSPGSLVEQSDATYQMWQTVSLMQKANAGDVLAQNELGIRYLVGRGVKPDTARGAYWTRKAAEQRMATAQFNLGILLSNGWGAEWNPFDAFIQFEQASRYGMPEALYILAQFYTDNLVVPRDWSKAYTLVKGAADSGYSPARQVLAEFERKANVPSANFAGQYESSSNPRPPATPQQLQWSPVYLSFDGDSTTTPDDDLLLYEAIRENRRELESALGVTAGKDSLHITGDGISRLQDVAEAGSPEALVLLGRCYERGIGVDTDGVVALMYYLRALRLDSPRAGRLLWELLEDHSVLRSIKDRSRLKDRNARFVWTSLAGLRLDFPLARVQSYLTEQQALDFLSEATDHIPSLIELGVCYYSGRWVAPDRVRARTLWERAAASGSAEARVRVAALDMQEGRGNAREVVSVLEAGSLAGSILGDVALGLCYEAGFGVQRNTGEAVRLFRKAATRGSQDAFRALVRLHDMLRPPDQRFTILE